MADDNTDDGGWETAPSRQSNKNKNDTSSKGSNSKGRQRSAGGAGQTRGRGGGGGGGGFGGWAKPKPPRPQQNAGWPTAPQSNYTSKESEMRVAPTAGTAAAAVGGGGGKAGEELTYLNAVPQREMTEQAATFQSLLKKTALSDLMADYGEEDKDFDKMLISEENNSNVTTKTSSKPRQNESHGVLAPHGKAPIHIELVSYGHRYGVPPEAAGKGGYSRSRPLPSFDVRDLKRAPHHVAKLSGLSHHVKRELLNRKEIEEDGGSTGGADGAVGGSDKRSPVRRRVDEVAEDAATALAEAIDDGYGHGSPLDMTVYIQSEYGRHRSVVIVEAAAIALRNMLRKNKRGRFGSTTVSVGTRHRDIDNAHRDEEAFGHDLRREAQAAKKQKEREERESR